MGRLKERLALVEAFAGRIHTAGKLSTLLKSNGLANAGVAAFELPLGVTGGSVDAMAGKYLQRVRWLDGVLLSVPSHDDPTKARAIGQLEPLIEEVIAAIAGWGPDEGFGVYELVKGELASLEAGAVTYQLDFVIEDRLEFDR